MLLSLGNNIYLYVKYRYLKKDVTEMERYAKNSYCTEFRLMSNSSYKVLSEDKLTDSLMKIDKAIAYVSAMGSVDRYTITYKLGRIALELQKQMEMIQMVVRKHGLENEFAKELHSTVINELEEVVDIIEEDSVDLEKLDSIASQIGWNTRSYDMRYYSDFPDGGNEK